MTGWGGHVVDDARADALCEAAARGVGLSGVRDWRAQQAFLNPYDTESDQRGFALGYPNHTPDPIPPQSCCTQALCAFLREAGKDGTLEHEGYTVDVLRVPQRGVPGVSPRLVGDSPTLLRKLAERHGLLWEPRPDTPPAIRRGTMLLVGGDDGLPRERWTNGGPAHGILIEREDAVLPGVYDTIEGGKGPGGVEIARDRREVHFWYGAWWVRRVGEPGSGRRLRWWFAAGDLPSVGDRPGGA